MKQRFFSAIAVLSLLYSCTNNSNDNLTPPVVAIDFDIPQDSVKVNPYGFTPLSALVGFSTEKMGSTVLIVKGKHGGFTDVVHRFNDAGLYHSIPVIGMYANYNNTVLIRVVDNTGDTLARSTVSIQTGSLPANLPTSITAQSFDESAVEPGLYLVSSLSNIGAPNTPTIPYMIDDYADIRWVLDYSSNTELTAMFYEDGIARLRNGNFYFGDSKSNKIYEVDLLGTIINSWGLSGYKFHHEVSEEPNGNFLLSVNKPGSTNLNGLATIEDYIIEINRQTGGVEKEWDLKECLNEFRKVLPRVDSDWMHVNSVISDSTDHTIIVSGRTQGVVKLDYDNNVKWILGAHTDWGKNRRGEDLNQFLLTPLDASGNAITDTSVVNGWTTSPDFEWSWYQHSIIQLPDGNMMIFDNGTARKPYAPNPSAFDPTPGKYSRAVEYKIDVANKTVQQVWSYGKERDLECYSAIISSVQYLPQKHHILFAPGYDVLNASGLGGKLVEVDYATKQVVAETSISSSNAFGFHRAKKISPYPDNL